MVFTNEISIVFCIGCSGQVHIIHSFLFSLQETLDLVDLFFREDNVLFLALLRYNNILHYAED